MAIARHLIVLALDDEFGVGKRIVGAGVVKVEMRADDGVDFGWPDTEFGEVIEDIFFVRGGRRSMVARVSSHACVDQDMLVVADFDEAVRQDHFQRATLRKRKSGRRELHEISYRSAVVCICRVVSFFGWRCGQRW